MTCSEPGQTICPKCGKEQKQQLLKSFRRLRGDCSQCFALKRNRLDYAMRLARERKEREWVRRIPLPPGECKELIDLIYPEGDRAKDRLV